MQCNVIDMKFQLLFFLRSIFSATQYWISLLEVKTTFLDDNLFSFIYELYNPSNIFLHVDHLLNKYTANR